MRGPPQGSVLGSFLFNVGIDDIEQDCAYPEEPFQDTMESHSSMGDYPAASTPQRVGRSQEIFNESPIRINPNTDHQLQLLPSAVNTPPWIRQPKEQAWKDRDPKDYKFIDDGVNLSSINMRKVAMYTDNEGKNIKMAHPVKAEAILNHIADRAAYKGMVVNRAKTSLMCITAATSYTAAAQIKDRFGNTIQSLSTGKLLGVTFDSNCTWTTHVENLKRKIRARSWTLNSLRQSGFTEKEIVKVYCTYIRPCLLYTSPSPRDRQKSRMPSSA